MVEVEKRSFILLPTIDDNAEGWGPSTIPEKFKDIPYYSPYNKGDKLGKAADWQQQNYQGKCMFPAFFRTSYCLTVVLFLIRIVCSNLIEY
jgi:hypothetical protein